MCGPLWSTSAFPFESKICVLKKYVDGPTRISDQIADRVSEYYEFRHKLLTELDGYENPSSAFCKHIFFRTPEPSFNLQKCKGDVILFTDHKPSENTYSRCMYQNVMLHAISYSEGKKTDNTMVVYDESSIGQINYFYLVDSQVHVSLTAVETEPFEVGDITSANIFQVTGRKSRVCIPIGRVDRKVLHMEVKGSNEYIALPPPFIDVK